MSMENEKLINCPARLTLDAAQMAFFDALPTGAPSVQSEVGCELEQGHEGSHASLGQQVDATMWWIQWTLSASEINPYTWCPMRRDHDPGDRDDRDCTLFTGHPGPHLSTAGFWQHEEAA